MLRSKLFTVCLTALVTCTIFFLPACKDKCKDVACQNGGTCNDGTCSCLTNYSGTRCEVYTPPYNNNNNNNNLNDASFKFWTDYNTIYSSGIITVYIDTESTNQQTEITGYYVSAPASCLAENTGGYISVTSGTHTYKVAAANGYVFMRGSIYASGCTKSYVHF